MYKYECKKILNNKFILVMFAVLFILNAALSFMDADHDETGIDDAEVRKALKEYNKDPEAWEAEYERLENYVDNLRVYYRKLAEEAGLNFYSIPADENTQKHFNYFLAKRELNKLNSYEKDVKRVVMAAGITKEDYLAAGGSNDDYDCRYQDDLIRIYSVNAIIPIKTEYALGWDEYFSYTNGNLLLILFMMILTPGILAEEYSGGMYPILHATKKGRVKTALCKLGVLATFTVASVLLFAAVTLVLYGHSYGFSSLGNFIQVFTLFKYSPAIVTVGEYLAVSLLIKTLVLFCLGALIMLFSAILRNYALTYICSLAVVGANFGFSFISTVETANPFKLLNLFTVMDTNTAFVRYYSFNFFNESVAYIPVVVIFYIALALMFAAVAAVVFCRTRGMGRKLKVERIHIPSIALPAPARSIYLSEIYKTLVAKKYLLVIVLLLAVKVVVASDTYLYQPSFTDSVYNEYMTTLQGELTDEKLAYIENERTRIDTAIDSFDEMREKLVNQEITAEEYRAYQDEYSYAKERNSHLARIESKRDYILAMAEQGKEAHFVYDTGWNVLFGQDFDYLLFGLLLLMFAGVFADEYSSGMYQILRPCKRGRWRIFICKYGATVSMAVVLFGLFVWIDMRQIFSEYSLPSMDAPLYSLSAFRELPAMSIRQFVIIWLAVKLLSYTVLSACIVGVSVLAKKTLPVMSVTVFVTLLPFMLRRFGLSVAQYFDYTYLLGGTDFLLMGAGKLLYAILFSIAIAAILSALALYSKSEWVGRRNQN